MTDVSTPAPLFTHLAELRRRLIIALLTVGIGFVIGWAIREPVFDFLMKPLAAVMEGDAGRRMIYTGLAEGFFTAMRLSFYIGLTLALPVLLTQVWLFAAPGLYAVERRAILPWLMASPLLFALGAALAYYGVFPLAWRFFLGFESGAGPLPVELEARIGEYLTTVIKLIFAFGLCFQLPVLLALTVRTGLIDVTTLKKGRRYVMVAAFLFAAILTPPDIISQIALAVTILLLFEASLLLIGRKT